MIRVCGSVPHTWYPYARTMRRRIILYVGPTNSGKTFTALQSLQRASSGIYCGPLRLLAWEVAEKLNSHNVPCSLLTGQERNEIEGAQHKAMTVEMADITREYECAVIDEIQARTRMIGCSKRGYAFTRALFGLAAKEIHLCGDPCVVTLIQNLLERTQDTLEVRCYTRLSPLVPLKEPLRDIRRIRGGDCIVSFSRDEIHTYKRDIEKLHPAINCSVVYGSLPPETRTKQAERFNKADEDFSILVASDAIGMGLNLNIQRIIFTKLDKFDGIARCYLSVMQVKQIAGRAGRFKSKYPVGEVTCLKGSDIAHLHRALATPTPAVVAAGVFPTFDQIGLYCTFYPNFPFSAILEKFIATVTLSSMFFLCDSSNLLAIARMLDDIPLPMDSRFLFCTCPVDKDNRIIMGALLEFARNYAVNRNVPLKRLLTPATMRVPSTQKDLAELESLHKVLDMYIWLSYRLEDAFVDRESAITQKHLCST
ncbi:hypothetical protein SELMODRAFT_114130 [Selaginella moellendorffii]|uniref:RNA helicase n=1 Tax=Selaginella moellendorffii TaxID=88036 RepID=D8SD14_SELML|nr:hypothetical protein SELMODRAFT_116710 [Selaginella moellendorffii]EFJ17804.1 hypothetical protein SELMODRAFT_114130 [Selaginella moellendorffii]